MNGFLKDEAYDKLNELTTKNLNAFNDLLQIHQSAMEMNLLVIF